MNGNLIKLRLHIQILDLVEIINVLCDLKNVDIVWSFASPAPSDWVARAAAQRKYKRAEVPNHCQWSRLSVS